MTPLSESALELRLAVYRAEARLQLLDPREPEDRRTEALADICDVLDRIDPGTGCRLLLALYPHANGFKE